ncbi:MAG: efflux RND transporter periplasmic adaptor subunit [Phycisphaeraceae bacterium]|nr:efflux RND transporter periplasmic adaptor subunit [Phycisphaeraceae bacterium]
MIRWLTIVLAIVGVGLGAWTVTKSRYEPPHQPPASRPSQNPFADAVAATGLIETATENILIAPPQPGLVTEVLVQVNDQVQRDQPLFRIDSRSLEAELLSARAAVGVSQSQLDRLIAMPRLEDVAPLRAAVEQARVQLDDRKDQLDKTESMFRRNAASDRELSATRFATQAAEANLARTQAELTRVEAGAWSQDLAVARSQLDQAKAHVRAVELQIERLTVRSPIDGTVLKRYIRPGEHTGTNPAEPAMVLGDLAHLRVRAQIDELDVAKVRPGAQAAATVRGGVLPPIQLRMVRIEPLARPKRDLAGVNYEFADVRVVEVLFDVVPRNNDNPAPIYPGQLVDVFVNVDQAGNVVRNINPQAD